MKIERLNSSYVEGYNLGNYYLLKHYSWGNKYSWILSKKCTTYMNCEFNKAFDNGEIKFVGSCKHGKELLMKLFNNEITFENIENRFW